MRGTDVLKNIVGHVVELEKPVLITRTKLQKQFVVFDLSENEYDWLARHLGHDIRLHREFYRLHEDVVELTKVSRLLMTMDTGEASKFSEKQLKDIELAELPPVEEEQQDEYVDEEENASEKAAKVQENNDISESSDRDSGSKASTLKKSTQNKPPKTDTEEGIKTNQKCSWSIEDKKAVFEYFRIQIKNAIVPGKVDCEACQEQYTNLKSRKWADIKFCVKNQISKMKKSEQA